MFHEADPHRQRRRATGFAIAHALGLIESDPCYAHYCRLVAAEPGIDVVVGGTGLAGKVSTFEYGAGPCGRTTPHHVVHHAVHQPCIARVYRTQRLVAGQ
ncbi:MAG: hypothetical protein NDI82_01465 [Anaeromyxobacteraceae bacterium]|nr:hypothetical protein [Anaeromyxobacteraceae bacterium]